MIVDYHDDLKQLANLTSRSGRVDKSKAAIALVAHNPSWGTTAYRPHYNLGQISHAMQLQAIALGIASQVTVVGNRYRLPLAKLLKLNRNEVCPYLLVLGWARSGMASVNASARPLDQFATCYVLRTRRTFRPP